MFTNINFYFIFISVTARPGERAAGEYLRVLHPRVRCDGALRVASGAAVPGEARGRGGLRQLCARSPLYIR